MPSQRVKTVSIAPERDKPQLTKAQKAFNNLIKLIEKKRKRLASWDAVVPHYQQKYTSELLPLLETSVALQIKIVHCLDRVSDQKSLSKTEHRIIANLITEWAGELVAGCDDAALKAIYNKHSHSDYDHEEAAAVQGMKSALEEALNIELGDDLDLNSPEDLLKAAQAQLQEKQMHYDAEQEAREARQAKRKKSAKQLAQEARQQAEQDQVSQSIREVYRKLASALHPDRETDPQERERKTALMQRANQAYGKNNLLQLLELQLELEHIDQSVINNIGEDRLKRYNKILSEQLVELEQEIQHLEGGFRARFDISPFVDVSPANLMRHLASDIVGTQEAIRNLENDLLALDDIKSLKAWLKKMQRQSRRNDFYDALY